MKKPYPTFQLWVSRDPHNRIQVTHGKKSVEVPNNMTFDKFLDLFLESGAMMERKKL